jgi:hypothetical protein
MKPLNLSSKETDPVLSRSLSSKETDPVFVTSLTIPTRAQASVTRRRQKKKGRK